MIYRNERLTRQNTSLLYEGNNTDSATYGCSYIF